MTRVARYISHSLSPGFLVSIQENYVYKDRICRMAFLAEQKYLSLRVGVSRSKYEYMGAIFLRPRMFSLHFSSNWYNPSLSPLIKHVSHDYILRHTSLRPAMSSEDRYSGFATTDRSYHGVVMCRGPTKHSPLRRSEGTNCVRWYCQNGTEG